jgi:WD40 repeat protein
VLRFKRNLFDFVGSTKWSDCACSGNSAEFVVGLSSQRDAHELHVWDVTSGRLVEVLKDDSLPKPYGVMQGCAWHPYRAVVATVDGMGRVCLWDRQTGGKTCVCCGVEVAVLPG